MKLWKPVLATLLVAGTLSCERFTQEDRDIPTVAAFDPQPVSPSAEDLRPSMIPKPSDLLMDRATGLVAIPLESQLTVLGQSDPVVYHNFPTDTLDEFTAGYMNTLDGFLQTAATATSFLGAEIDAATVTADSAFVLDLSATLAAMAAGAAPVPPEKLTITATLGEPVTLSDGLIKTPLTFAPPAGGWLQGHKYLAVLTAAIKDVNGQTVSSAYLFNMVKGKNALVNANGTSACALPDESAARLEPLRAAMAPLFDLLAAMTLDRSLVAQAWTFGIRSEPVALYDPEVSAVPLPNDLLMTGPLSTIGDCDEDGFADCTAGKLCLPYPCAAGIETAQYYLTRYLNSLDGWSATSAPKIAFTAAVDPATLVAGVLSLVKLGATPEVSAPAAAIAADGKSLAFRLATPEAGAHYAVLLKRELVSAEGGKTIAPDDFMGIIGLGQPLVDTEGKNLMPGVLPDAKAAALEPLRAGLSQILTALGLNEARETVLALWTFKLHSNNEALFDPSAGVIPFPNDILMLPHSGGSATVAIPPTGNATMDALIADAATLDGYSGVAGTMTALLRATTSPLVKLMNSPLALLNETLGGAEAAVIGLDPTVNLLDPEVDLTNLLTTGKMRVYGSSQALAAVVGGALVVQPLRGNVFPEGFRMMVAVTETLPSPTVDGSEGTAPMKASPAFVMARSKYPLVNAESHSTVSVLDDASAAGLEKLRAQYSLALSRIEAKGAFRRELLANFWTFTVQTSAGFLAKAVDALDAAAIDPQVAGGLRETLIATHPVFQGTFQTGSALVMPEDLTAGKGPRLAMKDGLPEFEAEGRQFLALLPDGNPTGVVLLGHSYGMSAEQALASAGYLADAGMVVVAMDLPLHGTRSIPGKTSGEGFLNADVVSVRDLMLTAALDWISLGRLTQTDEFWTALVLPKTTNRTAIAASFSAGAFIMALPHWDPMLRVALFDVPAGLSEGLILADGAVMREPFLAALSAAGIELGTASAAKATTLVQTLLERGDPLVYVPALPAGTEFFLAHSAAAAGDGLLPALALNTAPCAFKAAAAVAAVKTYADACHGFLMRPCVDGDYGLMAAAAGDVGAFLMGGAAAVANATPVADLTCAE